MTSMAPYNTTALNYKNLETKNVVIDKGSITGLIMSNPDFSIFNEILIKSGMVEKLSDIQANCTLFVTSNQSIITRYEPNIIESMDQGSARDIILGSLLDNRIDENLLKSSPYRFFVTRNTAHKILLTTKNGKTIINDSINFLKFDLKLVNGIVHIIDDLILPAYEPPFI
jgi:uncharacterized surface protein with fasciclin (FAS1) repeats